MQIFKISGKDKYEKQKTHLFNDRKFENFLIYLKELNNTTLNILFLKFKLGKSLSVISKYSLIFIFFIFIFVK